MFLLLMHHIDALRRCGTPETMGIDNDDVLEWMAMLSTMYMQTLGSPEFMEMEKHLFITASSSISWKDAIVAAISEASKTIDYLLQYETFDSNIWEPCCGNGSLSNRLKDFSYKENDDYISFNKYLEFDIK